VNAQRWIALAGLLAVAAVVATSNLWLPLLKRDKKTSALPTEQPTEAIATAESSATVAPRLRGTPLAAPTIDPVVAALMAETGLQTLAVGDDPVIVLAGEFTIVDELHRASGTASIYRLGDKKRALRLEPFEVTNGPDLHVILSESPEPRTSADALLPTYVNLGDLKLSEGAQNYDIPDSVNLDLFKSVVIYSTSLNLVFSSAPLKQVRG
jgi:hypothetical protein